MDTVKTLRKKEFEIKPFKHIRIGDPHYFEEMENGSTNKYLKEITCDMDVNPSKFGLVTVEDEMVTSEGFTFGNLRVNIYLANTKEQLEVYKSGKWYGDKTLVKEYTLGCDTAEFEIETDKSVDTFHTGADGYYGSLQHLKKGYGLICHFDLDADMFEFEDLVERFKALF